MNPAHSSAQSALVVAGRSLDLIHLRRQSPDRAILRGLDALKLVKIGP